MDKITTKVMVQTGLTVEEAKYYRLFYRHAGLNDRVIMFDDVKFDIRRLLRGDGQEGSKLQTEETYDRWLSCFKDKGLISERQFPMALFPLLEGYTPFEDPEFYIAYRKRGDKKWNGRFSSELLSTVGEQLLTQGYEFRKS